MLVDTHCHLDRLDLEHHDGSLDHALAAARINDVQYFLCVAITLEQLPQVLAIAAKDRTIKATVGVHPTEIDGEEPTVGRLVELAQHDQVIAIGETGLDYYRCEGDVEWQRQRFRCHIRAARQCGMPVIVHSRYAPEDTIRILTEEKAYEVGGILHCFTGTLAMAQQGLELGFYVSFSGIVTFKNAQNVQYAASNLPLGALLIETDSPYLAPVPYRGKANEPAYVRYIAEKLAELHGVDYETIAQQTTQNYFDLFPQIGLEGV
jgi:TatD DNase family protein